MDNEAQLTWLRASDAAIASDAAVATSFARWFFRIETTGLAAGDMERDEVELRLFDGKKRGGLRAQVVRVI